jgi:cytoskeleton protein RodZ
MFEIGPALREARERRGVSLQQVEADTAIRSRYIRALEEEEFGILPGTPYAKGFLRAYADYLGLDPQLVIDEFNLRYHDPRADLERPIYPRPRSRPQQRRRRRESNLVMLALAAIVALSALVVLGFMNSSPSPAPYVPTTTDTTPLLQTAPPTSTAGSAPPPTHERRRRRHHVQKPPAPRVIRVVVTSTGRSWLAATRASVAGPPLTSVGGAISGQGFVDPGQRITFRSKRAIVLNVGAPSYVTLTVNGHPATLPPGSLFRITARGVSAA